MEKLKEVAPAEFLESAIFPVLLPGLEATLRTAKHTERRKRFNPLDYLSAYLFRNNPNRREDADIPFEDIPFVKEKWAVKPRPAPPLSATLTEDEAATIIQAHYRGYRVRSTSAHAVEFRKWQKRFARENRAVRRIQRWWRNVLWRRKLSRHMTTRTISMENAGRRLEEIEEGEEEEEGEREGEEQEVVERYP